MKDKRLLDAENEYRKTWPIETADITDEGLVREGAIEKFIEKLMGTEYLAALQRQITPERYE